ncbi:hypothetical protein OOK31_17995 [Streptomyces sp. NBC_00249]|uniref:hypothetical protein n=1 Tax=Streptomyces sp. NBC_00249 TaxID=2975690 RepID=UPI002253EDD7|nr:hypothetical protein [Streptomyces sp. NBC_00249]MCX5195764.1 hypothetical protein [Streptomyces sp. NBC_00249]
MAAKLIVYPPDEQGWRRVRYDGVAIGVAHRPSAIRVFLAAAGLENAEDVDLTAPDFVEWRGAGPRRLGALPLSLREGCTGRGAGQLSAGGALVIWL